MDKYFSLKGALRAPMGVGPPSCRLSMNPCLQETIGLTAHAVVQVHDVSKKFAEKLGSPKGTPGIKLTLQTLNIGQKVDDVHVCVILLEGNCSCTQDNKSILQAVAKCRVTRLAESNRQPMAPNNKAQ